MKTLILPFKYRTSRRISNWGYTFDSLTELKFAVSIMDDYEFLRAPVSIYYHPGNKAPVEQVRKFHRRYTPDFLIRNRATCEAFLIEIKPRIFQYHPKLVSLKTVAENYIDWKGYDWKYKVVYDDEIILSEDKLEAFERCSHINCKSVWKYWFEEYKNRFNRISSSPSINGEERRLLFVLYGRAGLRHSSNWNSSRCNFENAQADQLSTSFAKANRKKYCSSS